MFKDVSSETTPREITRSTPPINTSHLIHSESIKSSKHPAHSLMGMWCIIISVIYIHICALSRHQNEYICVLLSSRTTHEPIANKCHVKERHLCDVSTQNTKRLCAEIMHLFLILHTVRKVTLVSRIWTVLTEKPVSG